MLRVCLRVLKRVFTHPALTTTRRFCARGIACHTGSSILCVSACSVFYCSAGCFCSVSFRVSLSRPPCFFFCHSPSVLQGVLQLGGGDDVLGPQAGGAGGNLLDKGQPREQEHEQDLRFRGRGGCDQEGGEAASLRAATRARAARLSSWLAVYEFWFYLEHRRC